MYFRLKNLHKEIDEFTENPENLKPLNHETVENKICLAKLDDEDEAMYCRAKILSVNRMVKDTTVRLFFVDLGSFATLPLSDIIVIPQRFIDKLSFQVRRFACSTFLSEGLIT